MLRVHTTWVIYSGIKYTAVCKYQIHVLKPMTEVASNAVFACDLLIADNDEQLLDAIIMLVLSDIPYTCDGALAMVYLR